MGRRWVTLLGVALVVLCTTAAGQPSGHGELIEPPESPPGNPNCSTPWLWPDPCQPGPPPISE